MKKLLLIFVGTFMLWQPAQAIVELRAGYGVNLVGDYEPIAGDPTSSTKIAGFGGFNLDAIVEVPLVPFGFGLRYESMGFDLEAGGQTGSADFERMSALINYRFIDLFAYFGVIGTLGFSNKMKFKTGGLINSGTDLKSSLTTTVGLEGGVSLGLIMIGAEVGYFLGTFEDQGSSPLNDFKADGTYAKIIVGVGL